MRGLETLLIIRKYFQVRRALTLNETFSYSEIFFFSYKTFAHSKDKINVLIWVSIHLRPMKYKWYNTSVVSFCARINYRHQRSSTRRRGDKEMAEMLVPCKQNHKCLSLLFYLFVFLSVVSWRIVGSVSFGHSVWSTTVQKLWLDSRTSLNISIRKRTTEHHFMNVVFE